MAIPAWQQHQEVSGQSVMKCGRDSLDIAIILSSNSILLELKRERETEGKRERNDTIITLDKRNSKTT